VVNVLEHTVQRKITHSLLIRVAAHLKVHLIVDAALIPTIIIAPNALLLYTPHGQTVSMTGVIVV